MANLKNIHIGLNFSSRLCKLAMISVFVLGFFSSCAKEDTTTRGKTTEDGRIVTIMLTTTIQQVQSRSIGAATEDNDPLAFDKENVTIYPLDDTGNPIEEAGGGNKSFKISMSAATPSDVILDASGNEVSVLGDEYTKYYVGKVELPYEVNKIAVYLNQKDGEVTVNDRQGDYLTAIVPAVGYADVALAEGLASYFASVVVDPIMARIQIVNDLQDGEMGPYQNDGPSDISVQTPIVGEFGLRNNEYFKFLNEELGLNILELDIEAGYALNPLYDLLRIEGFYLNRTHVDVDESSYIAQTNTSPKQVSTENTTTPANWHTEFERVNGKKRGLFATWDDAGAAGIAANAGDYAWRITPFITTPHFTWSDGAEVVSYASFNAENNYYFCEILKAATPLYQAAYDYYYFSYLKEFYATNQGEDADYIQYHENWDWHVNENLKSSFFQNPRTGEAAGASRLAALGFNIYEQGVETATNKEASEQQPHLVVQFSYFGKYHHNIEIEKPNTFSIVTNYPDGEHQYNPESVAPLNPAATFMGQSIDKYYTITKKNLNIAAFKDPTTGKYPAFEGGYVYTIKLSDIIRMILNENTLITDEGNEDPEISEVIYNEMNIQVERWSDTPITPEVGEKPEITPAS